MGVIWWQVQILRLFQPLVILMFVAWGSALTPAWAGPLTTRAQAGFNPAVIVDDGGSASASDSFSNPNGTSANSSAFASPAGLSVFMTTTGVAPTGSQYSAGASYSVVEDTTFNYQPDYLGGQDDWVEVGFTGGLTGSIVGQGLGGTGSANVQITISGNVWNKPQDEGGVRIGSVGANTGHVGGSVRSFNDSQVININQSVSTGYFWVPRGDAVTINVGLSVTVYSDHSPYGNHGTVTGDFADTFAFDPYEFFDILTPGVTANSPSLGLVNNQLVNFIDTDTTAVPTPAALPLMVSGLAVFGAFVRRRVK